MEDHFKIPTKLPLILDGRFYKNIKPNLRTPGGIQATCTSCFGIISGTTKSTGNFLSHIKRRHKQILAACQLHCQGKNTATHLMPAQAIKIDPVMEPNAHYNQIKMLQPFKLPIFGKSQVLPPTMVPAPPGFEIRQLPE